MKAPAYSATGTKQDAVTLDNTVFGKTPNHELLSLAYRKHLANRRTNSAQTKTRGLVSGGGKKPWRQKGTGNARTGSIRNPLWRGGGITFGPTGQENYRLTVPKKMNRAALWQALSAQAEIIRVIESFDVKDGKTRSAAQLLGKLEADGTIVLLLDKPNQQTRRALANLPGVILLTPSQLTVFDVLNADMIIADQAALSTLSQSAKSAAKPKGAKQ